LRDIISAQLAYRTNIDFMGYEPCIVYLNGKYWGVYNIREQADAKYIENNHGIDSDSVDFINGSSLYPRVYSGSNVKFLELYYALMDLDPSSNNFFLLLEKGFDIDNFIDYFILGLYVGNWDWLANYNNNIKLWRPQNKNGKWRYMLYDTDMGFNILKGPGYDWITHSLTHYKAVGKHVDLLTRCFQNSEFGCRFRNRYLDLINTSFHADSVSLVINDLRNKLEDAMIDHISLWRTPFPGPFFSLNHSPLDSFQIWEANVDEIEDYSMQRDTSVVNNLENYFNLSSSVPLGLHVTPQNSGKIKVNTISPSQYPWEGTFINHSCSSTLIAIADSGFIFHYWTSDQIIGNQIYNDSINLFLSQDDPIIANFRECKINNLSIINDTTNNTLFPVFDDNYGPYEYQWLLDSLPIAGIIDSLYHPFKTGYYSVVVTGRDGCNSLSNSIFFDCNVLLDSILTQDSIKNSLHISCTGGALPYSYQWFIDSVYIEDIDKRYLSIYTSGTYYAIVEDINGCRSFTDTISKNGLEVSLYPNPTNGLINLQFLRLSRDKYTISVFDFHMNILHYIDLPKIDYNMLYTHTFNLDVNITGIYFIKIESLNNQITKRFIYTE